MSGSGVRRSIPLSAIAAITILRALQIAHDAGLAAAMLVLVIGAGVGLAARLWLRGPKVEAAGKLILRAATGPWSRQTKGVCFLVLSFLSMTLAVDDLLSGSHSERLQTPWWAAGSGACALASAFYWRHRE